MRVLRRFCALSVVGVVMAGMLTGVAASTVSSGAASADTPEVYAGTAAAQALELNLFGTKLTVSSTNVEADSSPKAHADGAGLGLIASTVSSADAAGANQVTSPPRACGLHLPLVSLATVDLACSQSAGATVSGAPAALATSNVAAIDVGLLNPVLNLLQPILAALTPLANQILGTVLTTVNGIVQPLLGNTLTSLLTKLGIDINKPVSSLITALQKATNLITIHVGDTTSKVTTTATGVVSDSVAQGATITVLPGLLVNGDPLLSITVGVAHTTATFDRGAGSSSADFTPALLTVNLLGTVIPVSLGGITLLAGTPLESTISLGAGSKTVAPDKSSASAEATAVGLDLLKGLNGGISLHLAHAVSAAGGHSAVFSPVTTTTSTTSPVVVTSPPEPIVHLATTGTNAPLLPVGFLLVLAGYLTRRSFRSRRTPR